MNPLGQIPALLIDGHTLTQSVSVPVEQLVSSFARSYLHSVHFDEPYR